MSSEIQDEAYTEAMSEIVALKKEIERLKFLNKEERETIDDLSKLITELADAYEAAHRDWGGRFQFNKTLIQKAREAVK